MNPREKLDALLRSVGAIIELVQKENRSMTEEEKKQVDDGNAEAEKLQKEIEEQDAQIQRFKDMQDKAEVLRRSIANPLPASKGVFGDGQNARDLDKFSLKRALGIMVGKKRMDGVEAEIFQEGEAEATRSLVSFADNANVIPTEVLQRFAKRGLTSGSTSMGSTIATEVSPNIFEMFRDKQVLSILGATSFGGLSGNVDINTQTSAGTTPTTNTETGTATEVDPVIGTATLSPHRIAAYTSLTTQLLKQSSSDVEAFAMNNLIKSTFASFQNYVFNGASTADIVGIVNKTGINLSYVASEAEPTYAEIIALTEYLSGVEFDFRTSGFAMKPALMGYLMTTPMFGTGTDKPIMGEKFNADWTKTLAGLKAAITNAANAALIFGSWDSLVLGSWGGVGLIYDPYTGAKNGKVELITETFMDAQILNPSLFNVLSMEEEDD